MSGSGGKLALFKRELNNLVDAKIKLRKAELESTTGTNSETESIKAQIGAIQQRIAALRTELDATDKSTEAKNADIDAMRRLSEAKSRLEKQYMKEHSFLTNVVAGFKDATARVINYTVAYRLMWLAVAKFRQSFAVAEELNKEFTNIEMVTLGTTESMRELRQEYAKLAVEMSATITQVAEGADEWLRQGKNAEEAAQLIKASMVMSRIGAIDSAEATTYLTSVLNGYKIATEDVMHVVDAMSQVDIESASSVDDLAIALQRSASTASMAGVSFERLLGYVATVREVTQRSASVVGESELYALEAA